MKFRKSVALALCIGAAGCSSNNDIETSEIANTSAELSGALVREIGGSTGFLSNLTAFNSAVDQLPVGTVTTVGAPGASPPPAPPPPVGALRAAAAPLLAALQPAATTQNPLLSAGRWLATTVVAAGAQAPADQAASELETFLKTRIFTEGNRESGNSKSATFRLRGSALCTDGTYPADPNCVSTVDDLELRIRATKAGGGFDFDLLVGPTRANPISLGLRSGSVAVTFDLGGIKEAAHQVEVVTGTTINLPVIMAGKFRLAINKLGAAHVSLVASIPAAIHVQVDDAGSVYDFTTGLTASLLSAEADASVAGAGVFTIQYGLARTTFSLPYVPNIAAASPSGFTRFAVDLGGLSFAVTAMEATPNVVEINGVGFGTSQTRVWAQAGAAAPVDAITLDLQDAAGAPTTLDVTVTSDGVNPATVALTPFELSLHLALGLLDLDTPASAGTIDDTYSLTVGAGTVLVEPPPCDLIADPACIEPGIAVQAGSITISATDPSAVTTTVTATASQCLYRDPAMSGSTGLFSDVCP